MATIDPLKARGQLVADILSATKTINNGKSFEEVNFKAEWMEAYGQIAGRCRDDKDFSVTPWTYEKGPRAGAAAGGLFAHRAWPVRVEMEKHSSLRANYEYEANYVNTTGYWLAFVEAAIALRQEVINSTDMGADPLPFDAWAAVGNRYALRVLGLRVQFYRLSAKNPF